MALGAAHVRAHRLFCLKRAKKGFCCPTPFCAAQHPTPLLPTLGAQATSRCRQGCCGSSPGSARRLERPSRLSPLSTMQLCGPHRGQQRQRLVLSGADSVHPTCCCYLSSASPSSSARESPKWVVPYSAASSSSEATSAAALAPLLPVADFLLPPPPPLPPKAKLEPFNSLSKPLSPAVKLPLEPFGRRPFCLYRAPPLVVIESLPPLPPPSSTHAGEKPWKAGRKKSSDAGTDVSA